MKELLVEAAIITGFIWIPVSFATVVVTSSPLFKAVL